jgi:hypothetical protein
LRRFDVHAVRLGLRITLRPLDLGIETFDRASVGAAEDEKLRLRRAPTAAAIRASIILTLTTSLPIMWPTVSARPDPR